MGFNNNREIYDLVRNVLERVEEIKDLGIIIVSSDMKSGGQCGKAAVKGNQILGMIKRRLPSVSSGAEARQ